jgi:hypothetical protein
MRIYHPASAGVGHHWSVSHIFLNGRSVDLLAVSSADDVAGYVEMVTWDEASGGRPAFKVDARRRPIKTKIYGTVRFVRAERDDDDWRSGPPPSPHPRPRAPTTIPEIA